MELKGRKMVRKNILERVSLCLMVCSVSFFVGCPHPGAKPIHEAAYEGDLEKVKELIGSDPNQVNIQDSLGFTPLQLASGKGHVEVVEYLLGHGADAELGNSEEQRPLSLAAKFGHLETVRILLEHGAKVNSADRFGDTPLHGAAMWSGKEVIDLLVSYGAEVNARDKYQNTPLHQAAIQNNIEAAKALVEHGADIFAKNYYDYSKPPGEWQFPPSKATMNKTPKEIAVEGGCTELAQYLQAKEDEKAKKEEEEKGDEEPKKEDKERKEKDGSIKGRACFIADTPVWIDGMIVPISKVVAGQAVRRSVCATPGPWPDQVEKVQEHTGTFECRDILLENGNRIGVVGPHYFMLDSGRWTAAQDLRSGTRLRTRSGTITIKSVTTRAEPYTGKVYNLKVKNSDTYMVGEDAVIVRDY